MMGKNKAISAFFVILGLVLIVGSAYVIISYASDILGAIVDFVTTNSYTKLQQCGIAPPVQFEKIKADLTGLILPFLYLGLPVLLLIISFLMFMAGQYYNRGRHEEEEHRTASMEKEIMKKMEPASKKSSAKGGSSFDEEEEEMPKKR